MDLKPDIPELSVLWDALFLPPFSLLPFVNVASLVGICCWTAAGFWIWLVALRRWIGTSFFREGRFSRVVLSLRASSGRSRNSSPATELTLTEDLEPAADGSTPSPLKLMEWLIIWLCKREKGILRQTGIFSLSSARRDHPQPWEHKALPSAEQNRINKA